MLESQRQFDIVFNLILETPAMTLVSSLISIEGRPAAWAIISPSYNPILAYVQDPGAHS